MFFMILFRVFVAFEMTESYRVKYGDTHMGVSKNRGTPNWMVYSGKPY